MTTPARREPRSLLLVALAILLVASVYAQVLGGPFLWDDLHLIVDSPSVQHLDVVGAFSRPFWFEAAGRQGNQAYFRPLTTLSFAVDYLLHADNPAGYHLTNLLLHLLALALLMGLLRRRGASVSLSFALGLLWALLPRLTEAAAWISGRGDLLAGLLSLAALFVYRPGSGLRLGLALLLAFGALSAKESGIAAFVALAILELGAAKGAEQEPRRRLLKLAFIALPIGLYVFLRFRAGSVLQGGGVALGGPTGRMLTVLEAVGRYAFMLLDPLQPRSLLGRLGHVDARYVALGVLTLAGLAFLFKGFRRSSVGTRAYVALGAVPLLLVLHVTPLPFLTVAADRYLYLPTAALLLALSPWAQAQLVRRPRLMPGLLLLCGVCGIRTFDRAADYTDETAYWTAAIEAADGHATPFSELGSVAYRAGLFAEALGLCQKSLDLDDGGSGQSLDNVTLMATVSGRRELATQFGEALVQRYPGRAAYRLRRASVALNALRVEEARAFAEQALALDPTLREAKGFLALVADADRTVNDPAAPVAAVQRIDMKAARFPEIASRLRALLSGPAPDETALREGLEFLIARGDPRVAQPLLDAYARRSEAKDPAPLVEALRHRLEAAEAIQKRLRELDAR
jgi:protein O-mannosyl-transferase